MKQSNNVDVENAHVELSTPSPKSLCPRGHLSWGNCPSYTLHINILKGIHILIEYLKP